MWFALGLLYLLDQPVFGLNLWASLECWEAGILLRTSSLDGGHASAGLAQKESSGRSLWQTEN